ncbi:hypothetical protein [Bartonella sp. B1099]|uniref:hypothetical protein n=1 Tax=Bartonella sp. B1099 TaxID=2911422 RepID=UPI0020C21391|nr:hypothetical protein [Bartonella sp. B1099]
MYLSAKVSPAPANPPPIAPLTKPEPTLLSPEKIPPTVPAIPPIKPPTRPPAPDAWE